MEHLSEEFWSQRYIDNSTGWDLGEISRPLKAYLDQLTEKDLRILIPGCGNGHEAEYLHEMGFSAVHILDLSEEPLNRFKQRVPGFPVENIHKGDFFNHTGEYDLILEQTMFCAIDPSLRQVYSDTVHRLLKDGGKLTGLLFNAEFPEGPPYGGSKEEYSGYFNPKFSNVDISECHNSVGPRMGREFFIRIQK